jgi:hypothetical protein
MRTYRLVYNASTAQTGATVFVDADGPRAPVGLVQATISGTARVTIQGRLSSNANWVTLSQFTGNGAQLLYMTPELRYVIDNVVGTPNVNVSMMYSPGVAQLSTSGPTPVAPTINSFSVSSTTPSAGTPVNFMASISGTYTSYTLDIDGGAAEYSGVSWSTTGHTYASAGGPHTATLTLVWSGGTVTAQITGITVTSTSAPGITVSGNGNGISNNDNTPSLTDHTNYGTITQSTGAIPRVYTVQNPGTAPLLISGLTVPSGFEIVDGISASIAPGSSDTFTVRMLDASVGAKTGNISFTTNVSGATTFTFAIAGDVMAPVSAGTPPTSYSVVTTVKTQPGMAAGDWITPIGIAPDGGQGAIPAGKFNNIWARSQSGGWSYVQIEQTRAWAADGSLKMATGHFKIPTGYVDGQKIDICVGNNDGPPDAPNWTSVTSSHTASIEIDVSRYEHKIYLLATTGNAVNGDIVKITITDTLGAPLVYQRTVRSNRNIGKVMQDLCIELTKDPSGRYRGFKDPCANILAPPPDGAAQPDINDWAVLVPGSFNAAIGQVEGVNFGNGGAQYRIPLVLAGWPSAPVNNAYGTGRQYPLIGGDANGGAGWGFYLWPRYKAGNPENFTVTVEVTRSGGSTLAFRNALTDTTTTISGEPIVMQTPVNRTSHTLTWSAATETNRSPYFNGRVVRQAERKIGLPGTTVDFLMYASWDSTGALIDTYIQAENSRMYAGGADAFYDVTAIRVNGVNQLSDANLLEDHRDLHHYLFKKWRWHKPKKMAMCDPSAYMRTDLHGSFKTFPTDDNIDTLQIFSRGSPPASQGSAFTGGDLYKINPVLLAARGGFQQSRLNRPLWSGLIAFDGAGGARPGIALYDLLGTVFLTSNVFTHWDDMLAIADNGFSNFPWYAREERPVTAGAINSPSTVDADQSNYGPHIYKHISNALAHDWQMTGFPRAKPMILGVAKQQGTFTYTVERTFTPNYKPFTLYHGYSGGSYGWYESPTPSHHPPHAAKVVYMVRPEACFLDSLEQYAHSVYTVFCGPAKPKAGGNVFDVDHRASWNIVNGNRGFAWPWRDVCHAYSMMWDAHVRKPLWQKAASDGGDYFRRNVTNTWGGVFHAQTGAESDTWTTAHIPQKPGNIDRQWWSVGKPPMGIDLFKSAYCTQVATFCHQIGAANLADALSETLYWHRAFDDAAANGKQWYHLFGVWNNLITAPASIVIRLNATSSAGFSVGQTVTVSTSGFAGTIDYINGNEIGVANITNWGEPLAGQTVTNGTASSVLLNFFGGKGYIYNGNNGIAVYSKDGAIANDSIASIYAMTDAAPWLLGQNYYYTSSPTGDQPFGFGSSSGYFNQAFHWKALYGQARFGTNATEKAKAQTWINFLNARYDPGAIRTVGQLSAAYVYNLGDMRLRYAIGPQHCWVAPSEIAAQAW